MPSSSLQSTQGEASNQTLHQPKGNDRDVGTEGGEDPIRSTALNCQKLFDSYSTRAIGSSNKTSSRILSFINEYQRRFEGWCTLLGVSESQNASLNYRLRHHPVLQDTVTKLLETMRENLLLLTTYGGSTGMKKDKPADPAAKIPLSLQALFSGVEEAMRRLNKVAISIQTASKPPVAPSHGGGNDDGECEGRYSRPDTASTGFGSGIDEEAMKKRLAELPEDVQGPIEWHDPPLEVSTKIS